MCRPWNENKIYIFAKDKVLDHSLKGLFSDIAGEDGLILETVEALETEDFFWDGIYFSGFGYNFIFVSFLVHFHLRVAG